ncbi:MAG TPA: dihydroneopterin aldolase [Acidimicrobiales bacterium]|nr:dihydroneopterin aldolase [Acidimicrobiales bacterium]
MNDVIEIRGLRVLGRHGALPEEQQRPQPFEIELLIETPLGVAAASDELGRAVDYGTVVDVVRDLVGSAHFQLLETLADAVAAAVLVDRRIESVTVTVRKLRPPIPADVETVGVRVTRRRGETVARVD